MGRLPLSKGRSLRRIRPVPPVRARAHRTATNSHPEVRRVNRQAGLHLSPPRMDPPSRTPAGLRVTVDHLRNRPRMDLRAESLLLLRTNLRMDRRAAREDHSRPRPGRRAAGRLLQVAHPADRDRFRVLPTSLRPILEDHRRQLNRMAAARRQRQRLFNRPQRRQRQQHLRLRRPRPRLSRSRS